MRLLLFFLFFLNSIIAQEKEDFKIGRLLDSISVDGAPSESFTIYFPEKYNKNIASAVVFIFDPEAKGKQGVAPFILISNTYNYILVCSNNSKNGPMDVNKDIASRLIYHIVTNYKIDGKQMYVAGFSGGSRLAGSLAITSGIFQGVIGCGASFQSLDRLIPPVNNFSYVGLVGDMDMNYQEMIKNRIWLNKSNIKNELFVSEKGHDWPSQRQILRAFDWLELQAFKKGIRKSEDSIIKKLYMKDTKIADSLLNTKNLVSASIEYERIYANYSSKFIESNLIDKIKVIKNSKKYKQEVKEIDDISILEDEISYKISSQFNEELKNSNRNNDLKFWKNQIKYFKENLNSDDYFRNKMIKRLKSEMLAIIYTARENFKTLNENEKLLFCDRLLSVLEGEN